MWYVNFNGNQFCVPLQCGVQLSLTSAEHKTDSCRYFFDMEDKIDFRVQKLA